MDTVLQHKAPYTENVVSVHLLLNINSWKYIQLQLQHLLWNKKYLLYWRSQRKLLFRKLNLSEYCRKTLNTNTSSAFFNPKSRLLTVLYSKEDFNAWPSSPYLTQAVKILTRCLSFESVEAYVRFRQCLSRRCKAWWNSFSLTMVVLECGFENLVPVSIKSVVFINQKVCIAERNQAKLCL